MKDSTVMAATRRKLVTLKIAGGASVVDAGKWADAHLVAATAQVRMAPKGTDRFAGLKTWADSVR